MIVRPDRLPSVQVTLSLVARGCAPVKRFGPPSRVSCKSARSKPVIASENGIDIWSVRGLFGLTGTLRMAAVGWTNSTRVGSVLSTLLVDPRQPSL